MARPAAPAGGLTLYGLEVSVYTRIVRCMLEETGLTCRFRPADPFRDPPDTPLPDLTPFGRVPVLQHGSFSLFETQAILVYLDSLSGMPSLQPENAQARARMVQAMCMIDSDGYWPMVRQVFAHRVFRPLEGLAADDDEIARGLTAARPVLQVLDSMAQESLVLDRQAVSLADIHLGPMIDYFAMAPEGAAALAAFPHLSGWWHWYRARPAFVRTAPVLQAPGG